MKKRYRIVVQKSKYGEIYSVQKRFLWTWIEIDFFCGLRDAQEFIENKCRPKVLYEYIIKNNNIEKIEHSGIYIAHD